MTEEWMLNDNDDKHLYELLTLEDVFADQKIVANFAQKKVLKYLVATADLRTREKWLATFETMLKQLEVNNGK
jgi:hypothetical protein